MSHLKNKISLQNGKYRIERVLAQGGFGITYLAVQSGLERKVAVKEFFMKNFCERDEDSNNVRFATQGSRELVERYRKKFLKEARNIARLNHPNIVRIIDVFEENGTAYYVMEYAENGSLADMVKSNGALHEQTATRYILKVADALDYIHKQKLNHLDIKPANIMLNEKDEPVLIDFGLSKQYDATTGDQTSTTPIGISEGYAPLEQYMQGGVSVFSPETDIYSLGATFYTLLTGIMPPNASTVNDEGLPIDNLKEKGVSQNAINVILNAMDSRKNRTKDVKAFVDGLKTKSFSKTEGSKSIIEEDVTKTLLHDISRDKGSKETKKQPSQQSAFYILKKMGWFLCVTAIIMLILILCFRFRSVKEYNDRDVSDTICIDSLNIMDCTVGEELGPTTGTLNGHEWVDLGLSVKWATCNVGASSPSDYGGYYAWGETRTKSYYDWNNYFDYDIEVSVLENSAYNTYRHDGQTCITPNSGNDTARENWGSTWRMPTKDEIRELCTKCKWTMTVKNGHNGCNVTGPNGNSIFLPSAGYRDNTDLKDLDDCGYYWVNNLGSFYPDRSFLLHFKSTDPEYRGAHERRFGHSIRPVTD